jgi:hypothetical protein
MTRLEDRQILVRDIEQACADGAPGSPRPVLWRASTPARCGAGRPMTAWRKGIVGRMPIDLSHPMP